MFYKHLLYILITALVQRKQFLHRPCLRCEMIARTFFYCFVMNLSVMYIQIFLHLKLMKFSSFFKIQTKLYLAISRKITSCKFTDLHLGTGESQCMFPKYYVTCQEKFVIMNTGIYDNI